MVTAGIHVSADITEREWDAYVSRHADATVDHLWRWNTIFEGVFRHRPCYLAAIRQGTVAGLLPLVLFRSPLFGRLVVSLPFLNYGGVLADDETIARALLDRAAGVGRDFHAAHLELRHTRRQFTELACRQHKLAFNCALPRSAESLWSALDRKVRNQVRKAQKAGLTVATGGSELVPDFYRVFCRNMRDLGTPVYSRRLFDETLRLFPDQALVHVVRLGDMTLAAGVSLRFRDVVSVPWASSLREFRHVCPNMLLYWTMLEHAIARGATTFDFGRSSPDSGPQQFKRQWGASETPLCWEYLTLGNKALSDRSPASPRFERAVAVWSRLPLWLANAAGPRIVRSIP
jgi:FemAB-related protein (PEP-CTERM system-associated)